MEVEILLRKLEPLLPERVRHWRKTRRIAGPQVKPLLEQQIRETARKVFGDFRNKPLLSLPLRSKVRGKFNLGVVLYDRERWPAGLTEKDLMRNVAIFGMSGSGKTNLVLHLVRQLVQHRIPFLFLDWKRNARQFLPEINKKVNVYTPGRSLQEFPFNPFVCPPGLEANVYVNHVVDLLAASYTLGEGSKSIIQRILSACYAQSNHAPSIRELLAQLNSIKDNERSGKWKISAARALESLEYTRVVPGNRHSQEELVSTLLTDHTIVELDGLTQTGRRFLIPTLCLWLYYVQLPTTQRERLNLVVVLEEAHNVFRSDRSSIESVMSMLLRQCRELGLGIVIVDQHPSLMSLSVLGNTATTICLNLKDVADRNRASGLCLLDSSESKWLSMLPVGQAVVKLQDRWRKPFLVQIPRLEIKKGAVTDELLREYLRPNTTLSAFRRLLKRDSVGFPRSRNEDNGLRSEELGFLHDVLTHKDDGVDARYKRLGMSAEKGHRIKQRLVQTGKLEQAEVNLGRTRRIILRPTTKALKDLGISSANAGHAVSRESLAHEYWKRFYARKFKEQGYHVQIEAPRKRGTVDVLATRASESVAIEIETGKSDVVWNVKQDLLSGFSRVLVVATDKGALSKVEKQLGKAGLLGAVGRLRVALRLSPFENQTSP